MAKDERMARLVGMIIFINAHPGVTIDELARHNKISVRSCFRDLKTLCCAGVPLYCNNGGYRLVEQSRLKNLALTFEEALALIYGIKLLEKQRGLIRVGKGLQQKLSDLLPTQLRNEIVDLEKQVAVSVNTAVDYTDSGGIFKKLNEAIRQQSKVTMEYYSFTSDELTRRAVDLYQIVFQDGFWYLVAFCHLRQEVRSVPGGPDSGIGNQ